MENIVLRKSFGCCGLGIKFSASIIAVLHFLCDIFILIEVIINDYVSKHIIPVPLTKKGQLFSYIIIIADRAALIPFDLALLIGVFWELPNYIKPWLYVVGFFNIFGIYVSLLFGYNCLYSLIGIGIFSVLCYLWLIVYSCFCKLLIEKTENESISTIGSRSSDIFHDENDAIASFDEYKHEWPQQLTTKE